MVVVALGRMYKVPYYELGELISRSILIFSLNKEYNNTHKELSHVVVYGVPMLSLSLCY